MGDAKKERKDLPHYKNVDEFVNKYNVDDQGNYTHPSMKETVEESKDKTKELLEENRKRVKTITRT